MLLYGGIYMKKRKIQILVVVFLLVTSSFIIFFSRDVAAQEYSGRIWTTDAEGNTRDYLQEGSELYYTINLDESVSTELIVDYYIDLDEPRIRRDEPETNEDGEYYAHEDPWFFNPLELTEENLEGELGEVYLILRDTDGEEIDNDSVTVYEPDFQHSRVVTTEDDYYTEKNYYFEGDLIYFRADMEDQYGFSPEDEPDITIKVEKEGDEVQIAPWYPPPTYEDGSFYGYFELIEYEFGEHNLIIMDGDEEIEYASNDFTIVSLDLSIIPEVDIYTQEQDIEIRVESNYPGNISVAITNSVEEPYEIMNDARWENQELTNEFWSTEYSIPEDQSDGTYFVIVNSTENEETLEVMEFKIQKYYLEVETNKGTYLPGEEVKAYYTVENLLDGSQYTDVDVEWKMEYETDDGERDSLTGEGIEGEFDFIIPEDATVEPQAPPFEGQQFSIAVWANNTEERYQDEVEIERWISDLTLDIGVESDQYFVGQTLYVEVRTSTGDVEVNIELHHDGNLIDQRTVVTDGSGYYKATMELSDRNTGRYFVVGNATWNDMYDIDEDDFELLEESKRLSVILETDKGVNPYYPGEEGTVFYTVTRDGETVTEDVNLKYKLYLDQRVLDMDFAQNGEIDFGVPSDYNPSIESNLEMDVEARIDREVQGFSSITIPVSVGDIILNPNTWEYEANDNISFQYEFNGINKEEIDSLEYRVLNDFDDRAWVQDLEVIISGTPTDGAFEVTIPDNPETEYTVQLEAVTYAGASILTSVEISLISGFSLRTEILTDSDYSTGVYQPGDEIEISYELVSRDGSPLPEIVTVNYVIQGHPGSSHSFRTNETEDTFTLKVPEINDGERPLTIQVDQEDSIEIIEINNDPGWRNRIVFGNISISGLIMTILILIALIIGGLAFYRTRSRKLGMNRRRDKPREKTPIEKTKSPAGKEKRGTNFNIEEKPEQKNQWSGVQQKENAGYETQTDPEEEW